MIEHYVLDVESKPDPKLVDLFEDQIQPKKSLKDPEKIKADIHDKMDKVRKKMSVDPDYCEIVCIGIKQIGTENPVEGQIYHITEMEQWFTQHPDVTLITFNGKKFDLPAIIKAGFKNGLKFPYKTLMEMTRKYQSINHVDLIQLCSFDGNMQEQKKLDDYLRIYCGTKKKTLGDEFFAGATDDELKEHCLEDLGYTEELFMKFRYLL